MTVSSLKRFKHITWFSKYLLEKQEFQVCILYRMHICIYISYITIYTICNIHIHFYLNDQPMTLILICLFFSIFLQERKKIVNVFLFQPFIMNLQHPGEILLEILHLQMSRLPEVRIKEQSLRSGHAWGSTAFSNYNSSLFFGYKIKVKNIIMYHWFFTMC